MLDSIKVEKNRNVKSKHLMQILELISLSLFQTAYFKFRLLQYAKFYSEFSNPKSKCGRGQQEAKAQEERQKKENKIFFKFQIFISDIICSVYIVIRKFIIG